MKRLPSCLVALALLCAVPIGAVPSGAVAQQDAALAEGTFFTDLPDLPLMPGMDEMPEEGMRFDKPEGRIVDVVARGRTQVAAVLDFYGQALPQLGWTAEGPRRYHREGEVLDLAVETRDGLVTLNCSLRPE